MDKFLREKFLGLQSSLSKTGIVVGQQEVKKKIIISIKRARLNQKVASRNYISQWTLNVLVRSIKGKKIGGAESKI